MQSNEVSPLTICLAGILVKLIGLYPPLGGRSCLNALLGSEVWTFPGGGWSAEAMAKAQETKETSQKGDSIRNLQKMALVVLTCQTSSS